MLENVKPSLCIIAPCFNEMETLGSSLQQLLLLLEDLGNKDLINLNSSKVMVVDDGSSDKSWAILKEHKELYPKISCLKLSRNFGHQNALLAGMFNSSEDIVITIDIDLQDDLGAIEKMINRYLLGFEIVYGVKKDRAVDGIVKKFFANCFYSILSVIGARVIKNHADFRLISQKVISALREHKEHNLYLRGIIPMLGFQSTAVEYSLEKRMHGTPKYSYKKSIALAINGITSFSLTPLRFILVLGFVVAFFSILLTIYYLYQSIFNLNVMPGWASTVLPIYFLGSIQLISLGVISEYIGKLFLESKKRPNYIIEEFLD